MLSDTGKLDEPQVSLNAIRNIRSIREPHTMQLCVYIGTIAYVTLMGT